MADFDNFMLHKLQTDIQPQGLQISLGGGYSFATDGGYPLVHKLQLKFTGYKFYLKEDKTIDYETNKNINNLGTLYKFYTEKRQNKIFSYDHPLLGLINVRFENPLNIPAGVKNGNGLVEDFEVTLIQVI